MMEKLQNALRVIFASTIVQCCEVIDGNLARWRGGRLWLVAGEPDGMQSA